MANTIYDNFYLSNEIEDQYNSHLDLQQFCTVDNTLVGTAGMIRKINRYRATNGTQKLAMGYGNSQSIEVAYTPKQYEILLAQNRFKYYDEEAMTDPMVVPVGTRHMGTDMFNTVNADIFAEFNEAVKVIPVAKFDFDCFADAQAMMEVEDLEGLSAFAFVAPSDVAAIRKELKTSLQYVESFVRAGYIGTVGGVNLYIKKDATPGTIIVATKDAVTLFNKKGVEVEQKREPNTRENEIYSRKYYLPAFTNEQWAVKVVVGTATAVASTETTVDDTKTYYEKSGLGYIKVEPEDGDNPYSKGWYTIA